MISGLDSIRDPTMQRVVKSIDAQLNGVRGQIDSIVTSVTINLTIGSEVFQIFQQATEPTCPQRFSIWVHTQGTAGSRLYFSQQEQGSGVWTWQDYGGTADN